MPSLMEKLKNRWGLSKQSEVWAVLIVYSLAGMSISFTVRPLYNYEYHVAHPQTPVWLRIITYILVAVPVYQIFLLIFALLFGQFKFFWEKEKRMFHRIAGKFTPSPKPTLQAAEEKSSENI